MTIHVVTNSKNYFIHSHEIREVATTNGAIYFRLCLPVILKSNNNFVNDAITVGCANPLQEQERVFKAIKENENIVIIANDFVISD